MASDSQDNSEERFRIIERYFRAIKSEGESSGFSDCYGFIHKTKSEAESVKIPSCRSNHLLIGRFRKFNSCADTSRKVFKMVKSGIPHGIRSNVWKLILNVDEIRQCKRGIYKKILVQSLWYSPHVTQIHLDVLRTFRNHVSYCEEYGTKQCQLFNVLLAYSTYNAEVGYCQGMSEVAALMLMFMDEEEAFWAFERLFSFPLYNLHGIFTLNFPRLFALQEHHDRLLRLYSKSLYRHLVKKCEITSPLYTFRWFMQCFIGKIPFSATLRVYDMFFAEGDTVLTVMAFVIIRTLKREIKSSQFDGIMSLLNKFPLFEEDMSDKVFKKYMKYKKIFEKDNHHCAPRTPQTIPRIPLILTDPARYQKECALINPRHATYEQVIANGIRNIEAKKVESDDDESCQSDISPVTIESNNFSDITSASYSPSLKNVSIHSMPKRESRKKTGWKATRL